MKKGILFLLLVAFTMTTRAESKLKWYSINEVIELQKTAPKKVLVDVYTSWCGWCKVMDKKTFSNDTIIDIINKYFYAVKFDGESKDTYTFLGKEYKFVAGGRNGYNELAAAWLQGKLSYPTIVYLDENLATIYPVPGYYEPKQIEPVLMYTALEKYKTTSYEDYTKSFVSIFK